MADNVTIPATGTGSTTPVVATDDVAGVHFQKVKLDGGGDGATSPIGGDTTNGLDVDVTRVQGNVDVEGVAAHDDAVSGNPVLQGAEARTAAGTAVGNGDLVRLLADVFGKLVMVPGALIEEYSSGRVNLTNTTASDVLASAGAGVKWVVTAVIVTNAHASVSTKVEIRDGTTVKAIGYALAAGGGFVMSNGGAPLFVGTAATAVTARNVTTGSDTEIFIVGYKVKN